MQEVQANGEDVRLAKEVPLSMMIYDEKTVYLALNDENVMFADTIDLIITNPRYAKSMSEYFNSLWSKADTLEKAEKN